MIRKITRRRALGVGFHATGIADLLGGISTVRAQSDPPAPPAATSLASQPEVFAPRMLSSEQGELVFTLSAQPVKVEVCTPQLFTTYTHEGVLPGYTGAVRPGDVMRFTLENDLPALPPGLHTDMTRPRQWTTTNIHGMHVEPGKDFDNVFIPIPPGTEWDYEIEILDDQPAGLFWYHPHRHCAVAMAQATRGDRCDDSRAVQLPGR